MRALVNVDTVLTALDGRREGPGRRGLHVQPLSLSAYVTSDQKYLSLPSSFPGQPRHTSSVHYTRQYMDPAAVNCVRLK
jgi:hypothetical protein